MCCKISSVGEASLSKPKDSHATCVVATDSSVFYYPTNLPGNTKVADPVDNELPAVVNITDRSALPEPTAIAVQQAARDRNIKIMQYSRESYGMLKTELISSLLPEDIVALQDSIMAFLHIHQQNILTVSQQFMAH